MKKTKQPKKKKTFFGFLSKIFLVFAILFFLLAITAILDGVMIALVFCAACGLLCLWVYRLLKKSNKLNEQSAEQAVASAATAASSLASSLKILDDTTVEIVFPDGHSEQHQAYEKVNDACLITEGGKTYHNKVGCFKKWSAEYRNNFSKWQIISIEEAEQMGMRRCRFCYAYELAKESSTAIELSLSCSAKKYQENLQWCKVGEKCGIEYDYDKERYTVLSGSGDEIGYLSEKIEQASGIDFDRADIFVDEITEQDDGKYKAMVLIN